MFSGIEEKLSVRSQLNQVGEFPHEMWGLFFPIGHGILRMAELKKEARVLDIGSSWGFPLIDLISGLGETASCVSINNVPAGKEAILKRMSLLDMNNITIKDCPPESMPFPDASFNLIIANNTVRQFRDIDRAFSEIGRVAQKGAQFVFSVCLSESVALFFRILKSTMNSLGLYHSSDKLSAYLAERKLTIKYITMLCEENGFTVTRVQTDDIAHRFLNGTALLNHFYVRMNYIPMIRCMVGNAMDSGEFTKIFEEQLNTYAEFSGELDMQVVTSVFDCRKK